MGFNAGHAVEPLEWDFTEFDAGKGVSPEPSTAQIERYTRRQRNITEALMRTQQTAIEQESERLTAMTPDEAKQETLRWANLTYGEAFDLLERELLDNKLPAAEEMIRKYAELVAETTKDCPNADQIMKLPHRVRIAFFAWFTGQLMSPEPVAADTKPSLSLVSSV